MPKLFSHKKLIILAAIAIILITTGAKCGSIPENQKYGKPDPVQLTYWGVYEDTSNIQPLISAYRARHPHVNIRYQKFTFDEYEDQLIRALAEDRGPDIVTIHTTWMRSYLNYLQNMPPEVTIAYQIEKGTIKKEDYTEFRTHRTVSLRELRTLFPDIVYNNQVINNQIYGLPLSIDTLALYYNRDLLNNANIADPPANWDEFALQVEKLTKQDARGNIIQSGAAIGTADNVVRSVDLLSLLMIQVGTEMTDPNGYVIFNKMPTGQSRTTLPAVEALNFYTGFASPAKRVYTWNESMTENSLQAFLAEKTAFYFGYAYDLPTINAKGINFGITQVPQIGSPVNIGNYWVESVMKKSQHQDEAWHFIVFMATNADNNKKYLDNNKKPTALRQFIAEQSEDFDLAPFANQLLTATSWYKGKDPAAAENIMKTMIRDNLSGIMKTNDIIGLGAKELIKQFINKFHIKFIQKYFKPVVIVLTLLFLLFPLASQAFSFTDAMDAGCLKCGNCSPCDMLKFAISIGEAILLIVGALTLMFLIYGGIVLTLSAGSSDKVGLGKKIVYQSIIGLLIVVLAYSVIIFAVSKTAGSNFKWQTNVECFPKPCTVDKCGDGSCTGTESPANCPADCNP